ncbi:uncharacterized protein BX663DRAFT_427228 [Cokeromyces recurvatus]|uniref:uncharacterized protein n=1 Tax=Cokeromyces recurvatus TaxID=90255 RepID=UPI0022205A9A|nr:uncharacterized protein BX663DRAFT_427228 [Cokeromyces recurvatus]KAI7906278.1 hypothetical protein BX663DRAFT_427228 [Cokeromyces recurvatus]
MPNDATKKIMDGIGIASTDGMEEVLVESSGESDNGHTIEDSIKLMECAAICLKQEMNKYGEASFETMLKRKMLCLQINENKITLLSMKVLRDGKWACVTERSAVVPRK